MIEKIVSGGQTGVDQAGLDAAIEVGLDHGGWCPLGRICEDGVIPEKYRLKETDSQKYKKRTEKNVIDSDGTLILYRNKLSGGTAFTLRMAQKHDRPFLLFDLEKRDEPDIIQSWLEDAAIRILNVAGPRESSSAGIRDQAFHLLTRILNQSAEVE